LPRVVVLWFGTADNSGETIKGFQVGLVACDQDLLPLEARLAEAADEGELDEIYETERQLLYVACTRARDRLLVTGVRPGSEFLKDL
jgi:superfamily I DNA/RNA helicase